MNRVYVLFLPAILVYSAIVPIYSDSALSRAATTEASSTQPSAVDGAEPAVGTETIVFLRHAEKPKDDLGQLTPQGLNRALALSRVLPSMFGKPDFIYAPDPSLTKVGFKKTAYFYVRPLATIEPTAIVLGMPIQTPYGFAEIDKLDAALTAPRNAAATIFVAWEHAYAQKAVAKLVKQFGGDERQVPPWPGKDYDSLYVVKIIRENGEPPRVVFTHEQEKLDHQSLEMPSPAATN